MTYLYVLRFEMQESEEPTTIALPIHNIEKRGGLLLLCDIF